MVPELLRVFHVETLVKACHHTLTVPFLNDEHFQVIVPDFQLLGFTRVCNGKLTKVPLEVVDFGPELATLAKFVCQVGQDPLIHLRSTLLPQDWLNVALAVLVEQFNRHSDRFEAV